MQAVLCSVPTLAVSAIYCLWHFHGEQLRRRNRVLRERVAYMLWVVASRAA
jgi:hypothetical protein